MSWSGSRVNCDRREASFARSVIARAEQLRRKAEARDALPEPERCLYCGNPVSPDHNPYCSVQCVVDSENDS